MTDKPGMPAGEVFGPRIVVIGVGGAGGNAVNNMINAKLAGVDFVVANTDAQALGMSLCERRVQMGRDLTQGLGAGSRPDIGRAAAEEAIKDILEAVEDANMVFITAGMGGGTGTGSAPIVAKAARDAGILTIGVVTKPFLFEGKRRMALAEAGVEEMAEHVDTLIVIPNQNLFRVANDKTTFADAFKMADDVLHAGVRGVTDLMVTPGLINLDFADVRAVMTEMGKAIMGSGEAEGENRALDAAEAAIANPLLDEVSMKGARGVLINITGGMDLTLFEIDQAANRIRDEVETDANIIFGSTFDDTMAGRMRVSLVAAGIDAEDMPRPAAGSSKRPIVSLYSEQVQTGVYETGARETGEEFKEESAAPESEPEAETSSEPPGSTGSTGSTGRTEPDESPDERPDGSPDESGDQEGDAPRRAAAPVFPFRARTRERKSPERGGGLGAGPASGAAGGGSGNAGQSATSRSLASEAPEPDARAAGDSPANEALILREIAAEEARAREAAESARAEEAETRLETPGESPRETPRESPRESLVEAAAKPALVVAEPEAPATAPKSVESGAEKSGADDSGAVGSASGGPRDGAMDLERESRLQSPGSPASGAEEAMPAEDAKPKKPGGLFSWISSGGDQAEEFFKKADRYYHGQGVRKNLEAAFKSYLKAAEGGHAAAQNRVGWMYEKGEGVASDHAEAVKWYKRAADQGYVNAMNDLGYMYRQGWGVPQDHHQALLWFERAASKYDSYAEYNMGQMFENGWGVEKNMDEAIRWFRRSAARGHEWAAKRLEELGIKT